MSSSISISFSITITISISVSFVFSEIQLYTFVFSDIQVYTFVCGCMRLYYSRFASLAISLPRIRPVCLTSSMELACEPTSISRAPADKS